MGIRTFLWNIAIKKGVTALAKVIVAFLTSVKLAPILAQYGVTIDPVVLIGSLTALLTGLLEMIRNWLKYKIGLKWL